MPTSYTEYGHACGFLLSEANGHRSRDNGVLVSGAVVKAGQVLGKITASGKYTYYDNGASDGTQAAAGIALAPADATDGDVKIAFIARDAEVNYNELVFAELSPLDTAAAVTDLLALGIVCRT